MIRLSSSEVIMLGLRRGTVQVVAYSPDWARLFQDEQARLQQALGALALDVQHIGSTAVPGLPAKPILDIGIAVASETDAAASVPLLAALGYTYRGDRGASEGHFFDRGAEDNLTHYLHMLLIASPGWQNYLLFRDTLIAHPAVRDEYAQLKHDLAAAHAEDRAAYTAAKAAFVQQTLADARREKGTS
jgi:GrpB-like predicted nucleotidyltransferase (UPF0157 family)